MYYDRHDQGLKLGTDGAAALAFGRALPPAAPPPPAPPPIAGSISWASQSRWHQGWRGRVAERLADRMEGLDLVPDLGHDIGSRRWWRGFATLSGLIAATIWLSPGLRPLTVPTEPRMSAGDWEEAQALIIAPLARGADTGRRMGATDAVRPIANAPERTEIQSVATLGSGDSFLRLLERAGLGSEEARRVTAMVAAATPLGAIAPGTRIDIRLGERPIINVPRPLEALAFRARFDLRLEFDRVDGVLQMRRVPIAVDATPLRIRGTVGDSLYRSARASGAPAGAVQQYLQILANHNPDALDFSPGDRFDIIVDHKRAGTGEIQVGNLLYAGLTRPGRPSMQLVRWQKNGQYSWMEASAAGVARSGLAAPVSGRLTSSYGLRMHPILRFLKMHSGIDYGAPYGAPVYAVSDGVISYAGRKGGYGNFIQLNFAGGLASGYGHLSRIIVAPGQQVLRGQILGYVGSTGLSTGPHLHYEMYRNGARINPATVQFVSHAAIAGPELTAFKARLAQLLAIGGGTAPDPGR